MDIMCTYYNSIICYFHVTWLKGTQIRFHTRKLRFLSDCIICFQSRPKQMVPLTNQPDCLNKTLGAYQMAMTSEWGGKSWLILPLGGGMWFCVNKNQEFHIIYIFMFKKTPPPADSDLGATELPLHSQHEHISKTWKHSWLIAPVSLHLQWITSPKGRLCPKGRGMGSKWPMSVL